MGASGNKVQEFTGFEDQPAVRSFVHRDADRRPMCAASDFKRGFLTGSLPREFNHVNYAECSSANEQNKHCRSNEI
jgi:hypothetical protein